MKYFYFLFITLSLILLGCNRTERKIAQIPMEVKVLRIDSIFFHTPAKEFVQIKAKYPLFFPENTTDEEWLEKQADSLQRVLFSETERTFGDFSQEKKEIKRIYQHIKYYFPHFKSVKVVTVTSDVDYSSRVIYADSLLVIGLDNYLGAKHPFYVDIDGYIAQEMDKKYLPVDVALAFARAIIPPERNATFLDAMVYEGKILYLAQRFLPSMQEKDILKYTQEKYQWAQENDQPYKLELIQDFQHHGTTKAGAKGKEQPASSEMSFYTNGDFIDLCMGGHVTNTGDIPADGFHLDMQGFNRSLAIQSGVPTGNILISPIDTSENPQYFSHSTGDAGGRFAVVVKIL